MFKQTLCGFVSNIWTFLSTVMLTMFTVMFKVFFHVVERIEMHPSSTDVLFAAVKHSLHGKQRRPPTVGVRQLSFSSVFLDVKQ